MPMPVPAFGKVVTETSYVNHQPKLRKDFVKTNEKVSGFMEALPKITNIIQAAASNAENKKITIEITIDPNTKEPIRLQSMYQVAREEL